MPEKLKPTVRAFLEKPNFAILATQSPSGALQATPVWFLERNGEIILNTSQGRTKLRNVERNRSVALVVIDRDNPYRYVQIQGHVTKTDRATGAAVIDELSHRYRGTAYDYPPPDAPNKRVTVHVAIDNVQTMGL